MLEWLIRLTRPIDSVVEPVSRGRAQLIATILVFVVSVGTVSVLIAYWVEGESLLATGVQLAGMGFMAALIPVARGPKYNRAVMGFLGIALILLTLVMIQVPKNAVATSSFLVAPLVLASVFMGERAAAGIYFVNLLLVGTLGWSVPELSSLLAPTVISFHLIVGGILVMAGYYRDNLAAAKEKDLILNEERHRILLQATFDATVELEDGRILASSEGFSKVFGLTESPCSLVGRPFSDFFPVDEAEKVEALRCKAQGRLVELRGLRKNGNEFPVEAVFKDLTALRSAGVMVALRDITDRREMLARMQITDRMAAMGALAAGVAHEINNPLTFASGNLHRALERLDGAGAIDREELREWLASAVEGTKRVGHIVGDLNTFTRNPGDDGLAPLEVEKVVDTSVSIAFSALKHKAKLVREHESRLVVLGDPTRLSQVLVNLLINAAQALPEGRLENEIRLSTFEEDEEVLIEVADNGPGIPATILPRIFEPFFTTKPVGVGTGLGLSICKNLIEHMGGVMEVETSEQGTLFRLRLHVAEAQESIEPANPDLLSVQFRERHRILVVDDEEEIGTLLQDILSEHDVELCMDGESALERITAEHFDLVLCDLMMPRMTGMELYAACQAVHLDMANRFVFLTGGAFTPSARAFLEKVDRPRLSKPFSQAQIRETVAIVLEA
jgi:two-component system, cell cycle sensor histidine kinase and response regulator CckA